MLEIVAAETVFSYDAKYSSPLTEYRFDFDLPSATRRRDCSRRPSARPPRSAPRDWCASNVIVGHDLAVWVLEVNTIPGFTGEPGARRRLPARDFRCPDSAICSFVNAWPDRVSCRAQKNDKTMAAVWPRRVFRGWCTRIAVWSRPPCSR